MSRCRSTCPRNVKISNRGSEPRTSINFPLSTTSIAETRDKLEQVTLELITSCRDLTATRVKEAAAAKEAAKRQAVKDNEIKLQAAKANEEAVRHAREAEAARRAEQSSAAKRKAMEAKEAAKTQEDAKLAASGAEAEAIANATQEANAQAAAQRVEDPPTPSGKPKPRNKVRDLIAEADAKLKASFEDPLTPSEKPKSGRKAHDDPRLSKRSMAGPSKEDVEQAHRSERLDMGADEGFSDFDSTTEKKRQEERHRATAWLWRKVQTAERMRLRSRGLTRKGKVSPKLKLHELTQAKERAPSTPPPSNGSCKESSPDSALFPPESPPLSGLSGEGSKTTKNRRPSSGPRKTHSYFLHTTGISLPLADPTPPSPPNGTPVCTPTPLEGIARAH